MRTAVLILVLCMVGISPVSADKFYGWQSYTSTSQVRYVDYFDDTLQVMTSGGWLKIDPASGGMGKVMNVGGLGTNDLYYILKDDGGVVWLAALGRLIRHKEGELKPYLFFDRDNNLMTLYTIADDGDMLWVGTSRGLALFSKYVDDGQIEDFYFRFGDLSAEIPVYDIAVSGDTIWIATSDGLAFADKSNPDLLKSFANWETIKPSHLAGSMADTVGALALFHDYVYLGTTGDVFRLEMTADDTMLVDIPTRANVKVRHMIVHGDSLMIYSVGGFFVYSESLPTYWNYTPTIPTSAFSCGRLVDDVHWLSTSDNGIFFGSDTLFDKYDDGGLPGNLVTGLSSDEEGNIAGGFWKNGVGVSDGTDWDDLQFNRIRDGVRAILHDNQGNIWVGTWGDGLSLIREDTIITFKEENSTLHGVNDAPSYVVVNSLCRNSRYIFALNFAARDASPVRVVDMNDITRWGSFGPDQGLTNSLPHSLGCYEDVFVVGTDDQGLFYYYFGPDPFDLSDDSLAVLREANSWLSSDNIRTIEFDNDCVLWVGTKFGLSRYDSGIDRFVNVLLPVGFGPDVSHLAFDKRGNVWMGSHNGLAQFNGATASFDLFTTLNSGLSGNTIEALLVNPVTGDLWAGTREGISVRRSSIGPPTGIAEDVIAFPNPFVIRTGNELLSFNYDGKATVRIYTINGELIRETDINIPWDGKNQRHEDAAPGVYLFLVTAQDGSVGQGKILLIR